MPYGSQTFSVIDCSAAVPINCGAQDCETKLSVWEGYARALLTGKVPLLFEPMGEFNWVSGIDYTFPSRRGHCCPRPSQTRTSAIRACGSSLHSFTHTMVYRWTMPSKDTDADMG
jgi:hypothetical protein